MPKYDLVEEACRYCWSSNFMEEFQVFFDRNAVLFANAPVKPAEEQNLEFYELFQRYLSLYEKNLSNYINKMDGSIEDFYEQLVAVQEDKNIKDKKLKHFVNYLVASTDYASFYKIMVRAAKKLDKAGGAGDDADDKNEGKHDDASSDAKGSSSSGQGRGDDKGHK